MNNLGILCSLGSGKTAVASGLLANSQAGMLPYDGLFTGHETYVGQVDAELPTLDAPPFKKYRCRNNQLLAAAYEQIAADVDTLKSRYGRERIAIVLGTSTSGIAAGEAALKHQQQHHCFPEPFDYVQQEVGSCADFLANYADVSGIHYTLSTACSSSGKAFAAAVRLLDADLCDAVIVGGGDSLCELTLNGFDSLGLLDSHICNPFSANRHGINIGEGAALFILSKEPAAIRLTGTGESSDGYHITAPDPEGKGAIAAMQHALQAAGLTPEDISYINLHGTATTKNDLCESLAVQQLFGEKTPCSSTKPLTGHTLGASSAIELGFCWLLLSEFNPQKQLPLQCWDQQLDPALVRIGLIDKPTTWQTGRFMCNAFAFGGSNVSLIIESE